MSEKTVAALIGLQVADLERRSKEPAVRPTAMLVRACACHDSHGVSVDKDGTVTEKYEVSRCAKHRNVPSVYERLR